MLSINEGRSIPQMAHFQRIAVVGAGLIGGSVLLAAHRRRLAAEFRSWSRSEAARETLRGYGAGEVCATEAECVQDADLVVVATPVDAAAATFRALAPHLRPGCLVTDAGSVKAAVVAAAGAALPNTVKFVGAHPMAGSEKAGARHADASLFERRTCYVTPAGTEGRGAVERVHAFWRSLGCVTVETDPESHDAVVAAVSHLPHAAAAALMLAVADTPGFRAEAAGSGLRDATRIAAGEEHLWVGILLDNAGRVAAGLAVLESRLTALRTALERRDADAVRRILSEARRIRQSLDRPA
ncbi:MAG: prephenate dehydrogenase/arogenate dehydrogenase family protein [Verrucomicrobia bacterium]|nr:prephenate dehydrogenase/arogenate dehydrogenase family protein [Verrucomicrobiota bacterium]